MMIPYNCRSIGPSQFNLEAAFVGSVLVKRNCHTGSPRDPVMAVDEVTVVRRASETQAVLSKFLEQFFSTSRERIG